MSRPIVFLDRDGIINEPVLDARSQRYESPYRAEDVVVLPETIEALTNLRDANARMFVVSNQPAAAKGTASLGDLEAVHRAVVDMLGRAGIVLDGYAYCYHHPDGTTPELLGTCDCRKPAPGLIFAAAAAGGLDHVAGEWMVGDSDVDVEAGNRAGCRTILVEHPSSAHRRFGTSLPTYRVQQLAEAVDIILNPELEANDGA